MHLRSSAPPLAAPPFPTFAVAVETDGDHARVTPRGELDLVSVVPLERAVVDLSEQGVTDVVLDLSELTFFDSTALCLLLRLDARLRGECRGFGIVVGDGIAARVLTITRMRERFRCDDVDRG
ncbi:MAG TPA: STAS domain-containing protein [Conexibacter sp.]|nr:STAS domain-containing protein [Conexibacter sp.]